MPEVLAAPSEEDWQADPHQAETVLRAAAGPKLRFVYLEATPEEMRARVAGRVGHYMPASLVDSQFAALEPPDGEADVIATSADADLDVEIPRLVERIRGGRDQVR